MATMKGIVGMRVVSNVPDFAGEDSRWAAFAEDFEVAVSNICLDDLMKQALSAAEDAVAWARRARRHSDRIR